jgi:fructokinase
MSLFKPRRVIALGETVLDIILKNGVPQAAKPGGSMLNSLVSLGRCGIPSFLISETGRDEAGRFITKFLESNRIDTRYIQSYPTGKTTVALAFLDEDNNASYSFYREFPPERLTGEFPEVTEEDIVLFGSYFSVSREIREKVIRFVKASREKGALIIYDPNFRKPHLHELESIRPRILENISFADIVRGSHEDFLYIFGAENSVEVNEKINQAGCSLLICTMGKKGVDMYHDGTFVHADVPSCIPVSTIGAGDAFNAGVIYYLVHEGLSRQDLEEMTVEEISSMTGTGIRFATDVCMSIENYVSQEFAENLKK